MAQVKGGTLYVGNEHARAGQSPPCAWSQFAVNRKGAHTVSYLSGDKGWLHADGGSGFKGVFGGDKLDKMAGMAGVSRKDLNVSSSQGSTIAEEAIGPFADLHA
jgi:hypothetical protein